MPSLKNTNSLGMSGGEIVIDKNSQEHNPDSSNLNRRSSIEGLLMIGSITEHGEVLLSEDDYDDESSSFLSDEESSASSYHGSVSVADPLVDRIKQNLVGGFSKIDSTEHMNANGNRVVTSNQQVKRPTKVVRPSTSDSSIESSLASQSYNGSFASLNDSIVISHRKTLKAFKKMDSRNHMAKQGRVVKSCQEKRSSLVRDELMDRFLKKRASNASRKSNIIQKNASLNDSIVISHRKTLKAFKKMDSRNHMAKQGRVVKSCQEKRSSLMRDELMDRFLKKRASNASRKSNIIKKNDSFEKR
jgi:Fe-S-cluster-containing hydrogenase component 2